MAGYVNKNGRKAGYAIAHNSKVIEHARTFGSPTEYRAILCAIHRVLTIYKEDKNATITIATNSQSIGTAIATFRTESPEFKRLLKERDLLNGIKLLERKFNKVKYIHSPYGKDMELALEYATDASKLKKWHTPYAMENIIPTPDEYSILLNRDIVTVSVKHAIEEHIKQKHILDMRNNDYGWTKHFLIDPTQNNVLKDPYLHKNTLNVIILARAKQLQTNWYKAEILHVQTNKKCSICKIAKDTLQHIIYGCHQNQIQELNSQISKYLCKQLGNKFTTISSPISDVSFTGDKITYNEVPSKNTRKTINLLGRIEQTFKQEVEKSAKEANKPEVAPKIIRKIQKLCFARVHNIWKSYCARMHNE